jgi:predicted permease
MRWIRDAWNRVRSLARRNALEDGLHEEIRFHLDQQASKYERAGFEADEARRQAALRFGGVEGVKERIRDEIRPALLEDLARDTRHGIRMLLRAPGFTAAAIVTLALGIGATSAIFSIVRTVLLAPLPYRQPDRIVTIWETPRGRTGRNAIAPANFVAWRERTRTLEHPGMAAPVAVAMVVDSKAEEVAGFACSRDVFLALGAQPALGRIYTATEDFSGSRTVIVLGHEFWERRLGGRRDVLGTTLTIDGRPHTVIGVMPRGFTVVGERADFLMPYEETIAQLRAIRGRGNSYGLARLRDGISFEQARTEMRSIFADLTREAPQRNAARTIVLLPIHEQLVGDLRPASYALVGAVLLVLLVACVNVANLLLARSAAREREVGMRTALGAGRGRLVRQMLTESLVLAAVGGVAGLVIAAASHQGLLSVLGDRIPVPRLDQVRLDLPVVVFTLVAALATGLLFGIGPALVATGEPADVLREGSRQVGGRRLHRLLRRLVVAEVALSLVLLAGAGLLLRSFVALQHVDPGFRTEGVLTAGVWLPPTRYDVAHSGPFLRESLSRLSALPAVDHVAAASCAPMPLSCIGTSFWRTDEPRPADGQLSSAHVRPITAGFFEALGIRRLAGRDFAESDTAESVPVAIVSEELVKQQFPDGNPLGRRLRINVDHVSGKDDVEWTIVGVVGNLRSSLDGPVRQTIFIPMAQSPTVTIRLFLHTRRDPMALAASTTRIVHAMEPEAPVEVRTLEAVVGDTIVRPRAISVLVGVFALVALVLAAVGVYGVMSYAVRERTQEIGVRMALGASATSVCRLVLGQALRLVVVGVVIGLIAAAALAQLLDRLLFGVEALDPWTFTATALILVSVAAFASYLPARRGMHLAPVDALRTN